MKHKSIIWALGLLVAGGLMLNSCTKNDDNTIALIGTEYYIDDILAVVPDSAFLANFGSYPHGSIPPKIEGSYVMDPKQRVYSNVLGWPLTLVEPNVYLRFGKQHNGVAVMDLNEATEQVTDTVFVMGNNDDFTVYFVEDKAYDVPFDTTTYHVKMKRGIIMKGKVAETGLANFRMASVIMEIEDNSNGALSQYPVGSYFIYKDGDNLAEFFEW